MLPAPAETRRAQLAIAAVAVLLAAADTYVVALALPEMMTGVGLGVDELQRAAPIVSAFLLGYVVVLPLIGRLSDLHGRVPVLLGCLAVFAIGSVCTATGDGLGQVVTGRALQGLGAGGLVPATLALVADLWPPERRGLPLGVVGAVQEVGTVLGPLYGGLVLAWSGWRTIFWVNLVAAVLLVAALLVTPGTSARRPSLPTVSLAGISCAGLLLVLVAPEGLTGHVAIGEAYVPQVAGWGWTSPLALLTIGAGSALGWRVADLSALRRVASEADLVGAVLAGLALGGVVLSFATADPSRQALADSAPLLLTGSAVFAAVFVVRQRVAAYPLVPTGSMRARAAWGALAVNLFTGAALVAALVDVPVFARATRFPDSQLGASFVLAQLLVGLPIGALAGGWLTARRSPRVVAAGGMALAAFGFVAMARWDVTALDRPQSTGVLLATGLGFGLAIAPVNVALLAATRSAVHGLASALVVVARMVGMLVGLSALTAVGLRVFYARQREIGTPLTLCPQSPGDCPAYEQLTRAALLGELHAIFWGAALCAAAAALLAVVLLGPGRPRTLPSGAQ